MSYLKEQRDVEQHASEQRMVHEATYDPDEVRKLIASVWPELAMTSEPLYEPPTEAQS